MPQVLTAKPVNKPSFIGVDGRPKPMPLVRGDVPSGPTAAKARREALKPIIDEPIPDVPDEALPLTEIKTNIKLRSAAQFVIDQINQMGFPFKAYLQMNVDAYNVRSYAILVSREIWPQSATPLARLSEALQALWKFT